MNYVIIATLITIGGEYEDRPYPNKSYPTLEICEKELRVTMAVGREFWVGNNFGRGTIIDYGVRCEQE